MIENHSFSQKRRFLTQNRRFNIFGRISCSIGCQSHNTIIVNNMSEINIGTIRVKQGLAQMLKGGVIVSKIVEQLLRILFLLCFLIVSLKFV
jgi:hypothetical protein